MEHIRGRGHSALLAVAVVAGGLISSPAHATCGRDCMAALRTELQMCKAACPSGSAGQTQGCKKTCRHERKVDLAACRAATNPTPPRCGECVVGTPCTNGGTCHTHCIPGFPPVCVVPPFVRDACSFDSQCNAILPGSICTGTTGSVSECEDAAENMCATPGGQASPSGAFLNAAETF